MTGSPARDHWTYGATAWARYADTTDAQMAEVTARLLEAAALGPGDRVLELACGPGGVGLAASAVVGPDGEVVCSDAVPEMTAVAADRAAAAGVTNLRTALLDLDAIEGVDGTFDAVVCREGLMFASDPAAVVRRLAPVLRPGGRLALSVWGDRGSNPWLGVVLDVVGDELGMEVPPPGLPGPFALSDPDRLAGLFGADFDEVAVRALPGTLHFEDLPTWWSRVTSLAGPAALLIDSLPDDVRDRLRAQAATRASSFGSAHGVDFPMQHLLAAARRR